jgi:hypothetical protein
MLCMKNAYYLHISILSNIIFRIKVLKKKYTNALNVTHKNSYSRALVTKVNEALHANSCYKMRNKIFKTCNAYIS